MEFLKNHIIVTLVIVVSMIVLTRSEETQDAPLVNTTVGLIRGLRGEDGSSMFLGIPYAKVDENNPFGAAIPNPIFEEVFDAYNDSMRCPQLLNFPGTSLDCLHLSIHVPKTINNNPLPVFIYIHGGGFSSGSSGLHHFGPKFLIRHNVIVISFNYRVAAYGFMCLRTPEVPGNQGLKDQVAALRWIKKNIKAFGGDDESITIVGDSAGGVCVDAHILYAEEGLFHKVIAISGTSAGHWAFSEPDLEAAIKIARQLNYDTNSTSEAVAFLSNQPPVSVLFAAQVLMMGFGPCVEKELPNVESFATSHPMNTPATKAKNIPLIAGYTDDESMLFYLNMPEQSFENLDVFNQSINMGFDFGAKHDAMQLFVRRFYAADEAMSINLRQALTDFDSDFRFNHPTQRTLAKYLNYGGVAYHYVFSYIGARNMQRFRFNITSGGAAHADDLGYFLDMTDMREIQTTPDDDLMVDRITTLWTNFAKYGNPTPSITDQLPVQWLPVTKDRLNYLDLTLDLQLRTRPFRKRLSFWDVFYHTNRKYIRNYSNV